MVNLQEGKPILSTKIVMVYLWYNRNYFKDQWIKNPLKIINNLKAFYCPGKEAAMVIIVVNIILSFILFGKKDK